MRATPASSAAVFPAALTALGSYKVLSQQRRRLERDSSLTRNLGQLLTSTMVWFPLSARSMQGPSLFSARESRNFLVL